MIIKPHPKININKIIKIIDASANVPDNCASVDLVKEGSIYSYLNKVDLFITTYSSTGVEAIAFDVPIIMLLSKKIPDMSLYFGKNDVALKAGNKIELVNHIDNLIVNKSFKDDYLQKLKQAFHRSFFIRGNSLDSFANNF
jgi:CDP-glycerol glycerophosphotransferase (TagB/SpsB family)